ncbi:hypothetical protein M430DRAFT_65132, partial [Amorphotheca resinae ATCC 22711]
AEIPDFLFSFPFFSFPFFHPALEQGKKDPNPRIHSLTLLATFTPPSPLHCHSLASPNRDAPSPTINIQKRTRAEASRRLLGTWCFDFDLI